VLAGVEQGVVLLHGQSVDVGAQNDAARPQAPPSRPCTMPTTPVIANAARCTGNAPFRCPPPRRRYAPPLKQSSGWAWMSRRTAAMPAAGEDGIDEFHGQSLTHDIGAHHRDTHRARHRRWLGDCRTGRLWYASISGVSARTLVVTNVRYPAARCQ
jgi:hypothetical protein